MNVTNCGAVAGQHAVPIDRVGENMALKADPVPVIASG